ncbi:MAG TPA: CBS domain-containing protein [Gammaproteobacteria bacterium]
MLCSSEYTSVDLKFIVSSRVMRSRITVTPDTTLGEAAHLLVTHRISGLPWWMRSNA